MFIPGEYGQVNWKFEGTALPTGAEVTCGFWHHNFAGTIQEVAEFFYDQWATNIMPDLASTCGLVSALVKYGPNETGAQYEHIETTVGTAGGEVAPANTAILVTKNTIVGGRKGKGRMYIPCPSESDVSPGGELGSAFVTALSADLETMRDNAFSEELPFRLLHGEYDPQPAPYHIESFTVSSTVATQRRRQRR